MRDDATIQVVQNVDEAVLLQGRAEALIEAARDLERLMARQNFDATEDQRAELVEARKYLRWAAGSFERAGEGC